MICDNIVAVYSCVFYRAGKNNQFLFAMVIGTANSGTVGGLRI